MPLPMGCQVIADAFIYISGRMTGNRKIAPDRAQIWHFAGNLKVENDSLSARSTKGIQPFSVSFACEVARRQERPSALALLLVEVRANPQPFELLVQSFSVYALGLIDEFLAETLCIRQSCESQDLARFCIGHGEDECCF